MFEQNVNFVLQEHFNACIFLIEVSVLFLVSRIQIFSNIMI